MVDVARIQRELKNFNARYMGSRRVGYADKRFYLYHEGNGQGSKVALMPWFSGRTEFIERKVKFKGFPAYGGYSAKFPEPDRVLLRIIDTTIDEVIAEELEKEGLLNMTEMGKYVPVKRGAAERFLEIKRRMMSVYGLDWKTTRELGRRYE